MTTATLDRPVANTKSDSRISLNGVNNVTAAATKTYEEFITDKVAFAKSTGIIIDPSEVHPILKPHQRDTVVWACRGGRRGIFMRFGLGKSLIQLSIADIMTKHIGEHSRALIVCPLGVRQEFARDAGMIGLRTEFIQSNAEKEKHEKQELFFELGRPVYTTNYESIRCGKLDPTGFDVICLDEAAILRGFGSTLTFRKLMGQFEGSSTYRFVSTATPDPNEYLELAAYADWLGVMETGEIKTRWFKRDSTKADHLTLHAHKADEFWHWVSTWALFVQKPSDLGYSDEGYDLPPLQVNWHELPTDHSRAIADRAGQCRMFNDASMGLSEAAAEKRNSLTLRVERICLIVKDIYGSDSLNQGDIFDEHGRKKGVPESVLQSKQGLAACQTEAKEQAELPTESSCLQSQKQAVEGGESRKVQSTHQEVLRQEQNQNARTQCEVVREQQRESKSDVKKAAASELRTDGRSVSANDEKSKRQLCDLRRGSSGEESSRGPLPCNKASEGTAVSPLQRGAGSIQGQSETSNQGCEVFEFPQIIIWCDLNDEQKAIEHALEVREISYVSLYGSQAVNVREEMLESWRRKEVSVFLSKPSMYGAGINMQQAHFMIFAGIGFKFNELMQGIHRVYRFLQDHPVSLHLIYTEAEIGIRKVLEDKWNRYTTQCENMTGIIRQYGLAATAMSGVQRTFAGERREFATDKYRVVNNDCVRETAAMPDASVHLIVTSIPFSFQYEYSPCWEDFGHTDSNDHFWSQMDFLTPQLFRVTQPGRVAAIHVKDRIVPGGLSGFGFQTLHPFHAEAITHYTKHGFAFLGMKTVVTDVVRENNQTYRLGWSEQCKDGSRMGCGVPEYVLLFRRPPTDRSNGYGDVPIVKHKPQTELPDGSIVDYDYDGGKIVLGSGYSRARWQLDAHGFQRSSGNRLLTSAEMDELPHADLYKRWRQESLGNVYDLDRHVELGEQMERGKRLPSTYMQMPPHSWHPDVWTDITRMRTLNMLQQRKGQQQHLCPLQFDIVNRLVNQLSMPGEVVYDPFGGLMTVPYCAIQLGRFGLGVELNPGYFDDGVKYCEASVRSRNVPTLFDMTERSDGEDEDEDPGADTCGEPGDVTAEAMELVAVEAALPAAGEVDEFADL